MNPVIYTEDELRAKCAEWQKILRLQDWDVRVSIVRENQMLTKESNAEINVNVQHKLARLRVIDPIDYHPDNLNPQDMEKSLVHELLHIHLWQFTEELEGALQDAEEQALNMITDALIKLYRK